MPKKLEAKLEREATKKGYTGKHKNAYVYGTINKIEARKRRQKRRTSRKKRVH